MIPRSQIPDTCGQTLNFRFRFKRCPIKVPNSINIAKSCVLQEKSNYYYLNFDVNNRHPTRSRTRHYVQCIDETEWSDMPCHDITANLTTWQKIVIDSQPLFLSWPFCKYLSCHFILLPMYWSLDHNWFSCSLFWRRFHLKLFQYKDGIKLFVISCDRLNQRTFFRSRCFYR